MNRFQVIRPYLLTSLRKRVWMVSLAALVAGGLPLLVGLKPALDLALSVVAALCTAGGIAWSSYQRHRDDFHISPYKATDTPRRTYS
ncbi:hypothetical protein [Deinococcus ruber]|uniref:hypothetical protein n=1 Tax=Deinococcus ruber TaxID=1848197 RepID=UPI00166BFC6F|nr:hypothetical protein [Deinococcus ruber]